MSTIDQEEISQALQVELDEARRIIDIHNSMHEQGEYEVGEIARRLMDSPEKYGEGAIEHLAEAIESNPTTVREWAAVTRRWDKPAFNKLVGRSLIEKKPKFSRVSLSHLVLIERQPVEREEELVARVRAGASFAALRAYLRPVQQDVEAEPVIEVQREVQRAQVVGQVQPSPTPNVGLEPAPAPQEAPPVRAPARMRLPRPPKGAVLLVDNAP